MTWHERAQMTATAAEIRYRLDGCTCAVRIELTPVEDDPDAAHINVWHQDDCGYRGPLESHLGYGEFQ